MTYIFDFFKNLAKKKNIGIIIYLVINTFIIVSIFTYGATSGAEKTKGTLIALALYALSLAVALSPIGEWILRLQTGSRPIKRKEHLDRLNPLFDEVYAKAKALYPDLNEDINLFINSDESANAFATGRKTITINRGLLKYSDAEIKAVLAHEFSHLAHKDTDLLLIILIGNFVFTAVFMFIRIIAFITGLVISFANNSIGDLIETFIRDVILMFLMALWTKIGVMLVLHSNREQEYVADKFAYDCGYGNELASVLDTLHGHKFSGPFATLMSAHPEIDERIAHLQELGSTYRSS